MKSSKKGISVLYSLIFIACLADSCTPLYYSPNAANVPLLRKQLDTDFALGLRSGSMSFGVDFQGAIAVTNHIGIMSNFNVYGRKWDATDMFGNEYEGAHSGNLFEFGAGYFLPIREKMVFETYGGFGWGTAKNDYGHSIESTVKFHRYFIQPAVGWHLNKVNFSISTRICILDYNHISYDDNIWQEDEEFMAGLNRTNPYFIEPAFTIRAGSENIKLKAQVLLSLNPPTINDSPVTYDPVSFSIGFIFNFHKKEGETTINQND